MMGKKAKSHMVGGTQLFCSYIGRGDMKYWPYAIRGGCKLDAKRNFLTQELVGKAT